MSIISWPAPAKLNLFLHITGRRPDGYHELQTLFRLVDLHDEVTIALEPGSPGVTLARSAHTEHAMLAYDGAPVMSLQGHPEFSDEFVAALYSARRGKSLSEAQVDGAIASLKTEFSGLRTGRASIHLLDSIMVVAYGAPTPLNQVASVSASDARMLSVSVWDKSLVGATDRAIGDANAQSAEQVWKSGQSRNSRRRQQLLRL